MKTLQHFSITLLFIISTTSASLAASSSKLPPKIYTWTDENNVIHYSDKPINSDQVILVKPKVNNNIADPVTQNSQWQQDYDKNKQVKADKAKKSSQTAQTNKVECNNIKRRLAIIEQGGRLYIMSPEGERNFQTEEQLNEQKKELIKAKKKACR